MNFQWYFLVILGSKPYLWRIGCTGKLIRTCECPCMLKTVGQYLKQWLDIKESAVLIGLKQTYDDIIGKQ